MEEKKESVLEEPTVSRDEIEKRKGKIIDLFKKNKDWGFYLILAIITFIGVYLRTLNISKLKDITTNSWTLAPDLDPYLFLRWAEYIVAHGKLMIVDMMRNVPLGYNTAGEMKLLSYLIAWFHNFLSMLSLTDSITYSAILFPVVAFGFTTIAFFLFARKVFYREDKLTRNIIALIATAFFVLIPSLLPRTIAGVPEKESIAFFFMFLAFYFIMGAYTGEKIKKGLVFSVLAGISTALMALVWGGVVFIFFTISATFLISFIFGKVKIKEFILYSIWLVVSFALMMPFSTRYSLNNILFSSSTSIPIAILFIMGFGLFLIKNDNKIEKIRKKTKLNPELFSLLVSVVLAVILIILLMGWSFLYSQVSELISSLIKPIVSRFGLTVAENQQPYFINDWQNNFGPVKFIPLFFWMFFIGSIFLFDELISRLKIKERIILDLSYFIFLIAIIFSKYSGSSILNGTNSLSIMLYFAGWIIFILAFLFIYVKNSSKENSIFENFNFSYVLYFIILTLGIIAARSAVRLIMVLGVVSPVAVAFLIVKTSRKYIKEKDEVLKLIFGILALVIILMASFTLWSYYQVDKGMAENYAPGGYQQQWQKAMSWVRLNTSENAVFAHWWDYGYWLQSIGKRATILDGGNAIVYWDHLLGRYVLTGTDENAALEFLYTHNGTHLLIDSTEIGKYTAFSSIGSDENYDRFSWIPSLLLDDTKTQETSNETIFYYVGGTPIDEDIIWKEGENEIFLPKKQSFMAQIILKKEKNKLSQPLGIFVYNNKAYTIPLRYLYLENESYDFKTGLEAGIFIYPKLEVLSNGGVGLNKIGASFYLSKRTVNSQLAKLYLYGEKSDYFKLVHSEDNPIIAELKGKGMDINDFIYYQGFQGPIKIWEINYPKDIKINSDFLKTNYPNDELRLAKPGEY